MAHTPSPDVIYMEEEEHLSQRLDQLSTTTNNKRSVLPSRSSSPVPKKIRLDATTADDPLPSYLRAEQQKFDRLMETLLCSMLDSFEMEQLRSYAHVVHQQCVLQMEISLWNMYLRVGTGQMEFYSPSNNPERICWWPPALRSIIKEEMMITTTDEHVLDHAFCLNYVKNHLRELNNRNDHYQAHLNRMKEPWTKFTATIEQAIKQFVEEQGLLHVRVPNEQKRLIVEYLYREQILLERFEQLQPTAFQSNLFQRISRLKESKETSYNNLVILQQRHFYKHYPVSISAHQIPVPDTLATVTNVEQRQTFMTRYRNIIATLQSDMMALHIAIAETKMYECRGEFEEAIVQLKQTQHLTPTMYDLLECRMATIDQRFQLLHQLKRTYLIQLHVHDQH